MRFGASRLKGVRIPLIKSTADKTSVRMTAPDSVTIPMAMHIGVPANPTVKVGDSVCVGTLIGEEGDGISARVHSSVSGIVSAVTEIIMPSGARGVAVKIKSDGKMTLDKSITVPSVKNKSEFIEAIRRSGIVGLGGAGFPTWIKYGAEVSEKIDTLIVNGAECEPYLTSDTRIMIERREDILYAIRQICRFLDIPNAIIAVEAHNREAVSVMQGILGNGIEIRLLPPIYPQGSEKVLVYNLLGRVIKSGKLPMSVGCLVSNASTVAAIGAYLKSGMPLVERCITIAGNAVKSQGNIILPIGTSIADALEASGGLKSYPQKLIMGGPMTGITLNSLDFPIVKSTTAILAVSEAEFATKHETACLRCGECANHCPMNLNPAAFMRAYMSDDINELQRLRADICMECGCCSYICPAAKPLAEFNKLSKIKLAEYQKSKGEGKK